MGKAVYVEGAGWGAHRYLAVRKGMCGERRVGGKVGGKGGGI